MHLRTQLLQYAQTVPEMNALHKLHIIERYAPLLIQYKGFFLTLVHRIASHYTILPPFYRMSLLHTLQHLSPYLLQICESNTDISPSISINDTAYVIKQRDWNAHGEELMEVITKLFDTSSSPSITDVLLLQYTLTVLIPTRKSKVVFSSTDKLVT